MLSWVRSHKNLPRRSQKACRSTSEATPCHEQEVSEFTLMLTGLPGPHNLFLQTRSDHLSKHQRTHGEPGPGPPPSGPKELGGGPQHTSPSQKQVVMMSDLQKVCEAL